MTDARRQVPDPGRELLGAVRAPRHRTVLDALALWGPPRPRWHAWGDEISEERVLTEQRCWYADHPDWITAGLERHADTLDLLGLR